MSNSFFTLAEGLFLVSPWKPVILLVPFVAWASVISRVYDKHAARFHLDRRMWNMGHLAAGFIAIAVAVLMPIQGEAAFWVGLGAMILILFADLAAYAFVAN